MPAVRPESSGGREAWKVLEAGWGSPGILGLGASDADAIGIDPSHVLGLFGTVPAMLTAR